MRNGVQMMKSPKPLMMTAVALLLGYWMGGMILERRTIQTIWPAPRQMP